MRFRVIVPASLLLCIFASSCMAGTVTGTVRNGTTGKAAAGVEVILIQLQGAMQPIANTKTDAQGHYSFTNPQLGTAPMLVRVVYRDVNYHEPLMPGKTSADVEVYEPTDKPSAFSVGMHAVILQPSGADLLVGEEYNIENKTQPPVAYFRADGTFLFSLPSGAQIKDVSAAGGSGMPVVQSTIDKGKNESAIAFPFRPGVSGVQISYNLPYSGNHAALHLSSRYAAGRVAIFAPPTVQISADGFSPAGSEQGFSVYMHESLPAGAPVNISVSGTAPPPPPNAADSNAAPASGAPSGDNSQNPSVNSRLDSSGAEAPVTATTTLPARLDSIQWVLVAGFAALFALGFAYLWRRPQPAPVTGASESSASSIPTTPVGNAVAEVNASVRGGLDEMKDSLFRLELRHQAGTVSEEDYARERQRIEKALRDLVRG